MKFRSPTDEPVFLGLTSGHTVVVPREGVELDAKWNKTAIAAGCIPGTLTDEEAAMLAAGDAAAASVPGFDRHGEITKVLTKMLDSTEEGLFRQDGRYFGMRADGLYLLQGEDDNGRKIPARVNLGRPNMGDLSRKGLPYVYVGAASNGVLVLKVVADGRTYYYRASSDSAEVRTHRFTPGLGLRATNYDLEIQNDDGGAFDMASIEFVPVKLSRRI